MQNNISRRGNMKPKISESEEQKWELGKVFLDTFINMEDELALLGQVNSRS